GASGSALRLPPRGGRSSGPYPAFSVRLIKKLIRRVLRFGHDPEPKIIGPEEHGIDRDAVSFGARKVCEVLQQHGHTAYVVGGAVRDLMLGVPPKDFDVATSAHPEEVHRLMRRSRIIGRRFKLVHALFG